MPVKQSFPDCRQTACSVIMLVVAVAGSSSEARGEKLGGGDCPRADWSLLGWVSGFVSLSSGLTSGAALGGGDERN